MRLDELLAVHGLAENAGELVTTGLLRLARTIGEENVRDLDAKLVVTVQDLESTTALRDETVTVDEHTVDVEDETHVLGGLDLLSGLVLNLASQDLTSGLNWGHTRPLGLAAGVCNGRETRLPLRPGNGELSTEGVAGSSPLLLGGSEGEGVHVRRGVSDAVPGSRNLDSTSAVLVRDGDVGVAATLAELSGSHDLARPPVLLLVDRKADTVFEARHVGYSCVIGR